MVVRVRRRLFEEGQQFIVHLQSDNPDTLADTDRVLAIPDCKDGNAIEETRWLARAVRLDWHR